MCIVIAIGLEAPRTQGFAAPLQQAASSDHISQSLHDILFEPRSPLRIPLIAVVPPGQFGKHGVIDIGV